MRPTLSPPLLFLVDRRDPGTVTDWLAHEGRAVGGAVAGVEYGRLDYGVCGGRVQAFEINTNPTQGPRPHPDPQRRARQKLAQRPRLAFQQQFHAGLRHAMRALARTGSMRRVPLRFPASELRRYRVGRLRHTIGAAWRLGFARTFARHGPPA